MTTILKNANDHYSNESHPTANPGPLALSAFAMNTFVYSLYLAQAAGVKNPSVGLGLALFYGGVIQVLAGMWEMKQGDTFHGTVFSSYGGFWISFGFINFEGSGIINNYKGDTEMFSNALGIYLVGWTIFTFFMWLCVLRTNWCIITALFLLFITYVLLTIGAFTGNDTFDRIGGGIGVVVAFIAWYMALAQLMNKEMTYFTLSLFPRFPPIQNEDATTYTFEVDPMTCSGCTKAVEKALKNLGGVDSISFNLEKKIVTVETERSPNEIIEAISKTGKTAVTKS
ncbi:1398_t:CDS:2 [Funneliformis mosseae]|uniref:1398_t:CDS:1 n=1 Tax=Funneliformis mosseae TaxID=27381 RepID=A0A9N8WNG8_FUNMO|nr:1398_t:CDS:2 [Funneliformis mosseae]